MRTEQRQSKVTYGGISTSVKRNNRELQARKNRRRVQQNVRLEGENDDKQDQ